MHILLIRHGETLWNIERRLQGQTDIPLSDTGRAQAQALAALVKRYDVRQVTTSGLARAQDTARELGFHTFTADPQLNECYLGQWEGQYAADIRSTQGADYKAWRAGDFDPPGAETLVDFRARVLCGVDAAVGRGLAAHSADSPVPAIAIVMHGGVIRAALRALVGLEPSQVVAPHPASLTVLRLDGEKLLLESYNLR